jgi:hypothetical protein
MRLSVCLYKLHSVRSGMPTLSVAALKMGHNRSVAALVATAALAAATTAVVCESGCSSNYAGSFLATAELPNGDVAVPGPCSGGDFVEIPSSTGFPQSAACEGIPASPCDAVLGCCIWLPDAGACGCVFFALCVNGTYSECSCIPPPNGSVQVPFDAGKAD